MKNWMIMQCCVMPADIVVKSAKAGEASVRCGSIRAASYESPVAMLPHCKVTLLKRNHFFM